MNFRFLFCNWGLGALLLATLMTPVGAADSKSADEWQFEADIYLWGASIDAKPVGGDNIHISFSDIIDDLDMAFMGGFGARKGKWSLYSDFIYLDIDDEQTGSARLIRRSIPTKFKVELEAWIITLGAGYEVLKTDRFNMDLLAGARYFWLDIPVKFDLGPIKKKVSASDHHWDGIVGTRGKVALSDKWYMSYYGDVGTGDSDLTWQGRLGLGYRFDSVDAIFGYRYLDYDVGGTDIDDITIKGPYAGVKMHF